MIARNAFRIKKEYCLIIPFLNWETWAFWFYVLESNVSASVYFSYRWSNNMWYCQKKEELWIYFVDTLNTDK